MDLADHAVGVLFPVVICNMQRLASAIIVKAYMHCSTRTKKCDEDSHA